MPLWTAYLVLTLGIASNAWSAADGAHGSVGDLLAPTVNVLIVVAMLVYFMRKPLHAYFSKMSSDISGTIERASLKAKESQMLMDNQLKKLQKLPQEVEKLKTLSHEEFLEFQKKQNQELSEKISKLKTDAQLKVEANKKEAIEKLSNKILDLVIKKTKSSIKENKDIQGKVTQNILKGL